MNKTGLFIGCLLFIAEIEEKATGMIYQKFGPAAVHAPFVECYFVWESEEEIPSELVIESPPSGYCSLVFNYGTPYCLQNSKYEKLRVPKQFIAGQSIYSYKLFLKGRIGIAGIVLKPTALATLFHLPAYEFTEERADLQKIFQPSFLQSYIQRIENAGSPAGRSKVLESFISKQVELHQPQTDVIDEAAQEIVNKKGLLHITDLIKKSCMSRRTFERKFFQKVGVSPKLYARIRRIGYLCNLIAGKQKVNWRELFYECEFYDQAHFIKDFEAFTGRSPQQYLEENHELANYVSKPQMQALKE